MKKKNTEHNSSIKCALKDRKISNFALKILVFRVLRRVWGRKTRASISSKIWNSASLDRLPRGRRCSGSVFSGWTHTVHPGVCSSWCLFFLVFIHPEKTFFLEKKHIHREKTFFLEKKRSPDLSRKNTASVFFLSKERFFSWKNVFSEWTFFLWEWTFFLSKKTLFLCFSNLT